MRITIPRIGRAAVRCLDAAYVHFRDIAIDRAYHVLLPAGTIVTRRQYGLERDRRVDTTGSVKRFLSRSRAAT
jgi:hypothetical protein